MEKVLLNQDEIRQAICDGNNCQGQRYLAITPQGEASVHWADTSRPWDPWQDGSYVIGIPALYPDGSGLESEAASECLEDHLGRKVTKELENRLYEKNVCIVDYAQKKYPEWMQAHQDNQLDWLSRAFLDACNGDGGDINDPAPWGMKDDDEIVQPPFEFEWTTG